MEELARMLLNPQMWLSIAVAIGALGITMLLKRTVEKRLLAAKLVGKRATNAQVGITLVRYSIYVVALFVILQVNGVNVGSLATSLGLVTAAVAFAVQDMLKDFIMGANIMSGDFFSLGDVVQYQDITGVVRSFNIRVTKIYDLNTGNVYAICNREISQIQRLSDWQDVNIPTGYGEDVVEMRAICLEICERVEALSMVNTCEFLGTDKFGESAVEYRIRLHCNPARRNPARRAALGVIQDVFREHGVSVPFPQMDVHVDGAVDRLGQELGVGRD